jgi:Uma2 family endonuclease
MALEAAPTTIPVPASARFPIELEIPPGFDPADLVTWPRVAGRLEYVAGRLLFLPPCGLMQQGTAVDATFVLRSWSEDHPEFFVGGLEAGMLLGGDVRGADAAVWRRDALGPLGTGFARVEPILAVEVEGQDEREAKLREKARWYFDHGARVVWIVLSSSREVVVLRPDGESRHGVGDCLPLHAALPGLVPAVERFFRQLG